MTDQMLNDDKDKINDKNERALGVTTERDFKEETAAEFNPGLGAFGRNTGENERPRTFEGPGRDRGDEGAGTGGKVMGTIALILSLLSLFYSPLLLGAAGIIIGFIARRRGANGLGNWAIGIGIVSMIIGLFIAPFYYG